MNITLVTLTMTSSSVNNILGLPLNIYVMWLILTGARETLASDFFSLNLAMSEIIFALSCTCYIIYLNLAILFSTEAFMFSCGLLFTARPLFSCCICVEYYVGVGHPVLFLRFKPLRYRVVCSCVVWLITLLSCIYARYTYSDPLFLYGFFIQHVLLFSVMLFCCLSVLSALKRPGPGEKDTENKKKKKKKKKKSSNTMKRRAFNIILLIMISLAINFLLYMAVIPLQSCLPIREFISVFSICISFALTTGFIQPVLYLHRTGKLLCFRKL